MSAPSNLPPGTWEGDPDAPWNRGDPWEGATCGECRFFGGCRHEDGRVTFCAWEAMEDRDARNLPEADADDDACEGFEERG